MPVFSYTKLPTGEKLPFRSLASSQKREIACLQQRRLQQRRKDVELDEGKSIK
jgi:hypothetical protein